MNKDTEENIRVLREQGIGYLKISKDLGVSRDDVRNYCKKAGLAGRRSNADIIKQSKESVFEKILQSENNIEYVGGYVRNTGKVIVRCLICGNEWEVSYVHAVYERTVCPQCRELRRECKEHFASITKKAKKLEQEKAKVKQTEELRAKRTKVCVVCGKEFVGGAGRRTCSDRCRKKYGNRKKDKRISRSIIDDRDITLESLYRRDKGVCHICGKPCNYEDYTVGGDTFIAGNWYPSIDHVVPISRGGRHSWNNVKLAHRLCNTVKRDKGYPPP